MNCSTIFRNIIVYRYVYTIIISEIKIMGLKRNENNTELLGEETEGKMI